jgi:DNA mismatch repair protein MutL
LGQDFLQNTKPLENRNSISLQGVVGLPGYTRHNRTGQYLFINRRAVFSPLVAYAVKEGYGTSLATGRHPVFVLHLTVDGNLVDVNVHPQKREVRLRQEQLIKELIIGGVQSTLRVKTEIPDIPLISPVFAKTFQAGEQREASSSEWIFRPKPAPSLTPRYPPLAPHVAEEAPKTEPAPRPEFLPLDVQAMPGLKVLATIPRYIILDSIFSRAFLEKCFNTQAKGGLFLIDQNSAHARIIFEKLGQQHGSQIAQQSLLIPHHIEVSPFEAEALRQSLPSLHRAGLSIQEFGPDTFLIDAIPQIFGNSNLKMLIADIIHDLREAHNEQLIEINRKLAMAASKAAVKQEHRLALEEAEALAHQLAKCLHPYQCPVGKPTVIQIPPEDIAKLFQK